MWSRDINVNDKEKTSEEEDRRGGNTEVRQRVSTMGGRRACRSEVGKGGRWRGGNGGGRDEISGFSLLFPLIKISNMITADLATIIKRLAAEFAELAP